MGPEQFNVVDSSSKSYEEMALYTYSIESMLQKDKIRFYYALKGRDGSSGIIKKCSIIQLGRAVLLVPLEFSKEMEDFFKLWNIPFEKIEMVVES